jgi:predicted transposase YdaD
MAKQFDAAFNSLIERHLGDWVAFLCGQANLPVGPATLYQTDLSTNLIADKLIRIDGAEPYLLHLEVESSAALGMAERLLHYNVNAVDYHSLPVWSLVLLLRPSSNPSDLQIQNGRYERSVLKEVSTTFKFTTIRAWTLDFETLLGSGRGLLPLAMLTNDSMTDTAGHLARVQQQLRDESASSKMYGDDISALYFVMGLRHSPNTLETLFRDAIMSLEESSTYQHVLSKGRVEGLREGLSKGRVEGRVEGRNEGDLRTARTSVLLLGTQRFGTPPAEIVSKLDSVSDLEVLENLLLRTLEVTTWAELLA